MDTSTVDASLPRRIILDQVFDADPVVLRARLNGCVVEKPLSDHDRNRLLTCGLRKPLLPINGKLCRVHTLTAVQSFGLTPHAHQAFAQVHLSLLELERAYAHIFHLCAPTYTPRFFVVPSVVLRAAYFRDGVTKKIARVPLEERPPGPRAPLDYWPYLDAWSYLTTASP